MLLVEEPPFEPQGIRLKYVCLFVGCTYLHEINPSHFPKLLGQFSSSHLSIFSTKIGINKLQLVNLTNIKFLYSSYLHFPNYLRDGTYFHKTLATDNHPVIVMYWKYIFSNSVIFLKPKRPLNSNCFLLSVVLTMHQDATRQKDRIWHTGSLPQWEGTGSSQGQS